jgi:phosphoribosylamine--glycine ligase
MKSAGSVKDLETVGSKLTMSFTDRISVFDWGPLPDEIPGRAESLTRFAKSVVSHFRSRSEFQLFEAESANPKSLSMEWVQHPRYPGSASEWIFVPMEFVFRHLVAAGSSVLKRQPELKVGHSFTEAQVEFTTKLEATDRLLDVSEAQSLTECPLELIVQATRRLASDLRELLSQAGLELWDGKLEWAYRKSKNGFELALVDAITPDELRLTLKGRPDFPLSKELLRLWLQSTPWAHELSLAKLKSPSDFRAQVRLSVPRLGAWRKQVLSDLYRALADAVAARSPMPLQLFLGATQKLKPKIVVVGSGARESALAWRLESEGASVEWVESQRLSTDLDLASVDSILVSQDQDLAKGVVDQLAAQACFAFGPLAQSAGLEASKKIGRQLAELAQIPGPRWTEDPERARAWGSPPVVKKVGLAAGKGVVVCKSWAEFEATCSKWGGEPLLFEEALRGPEASVFYYLRVTGRTVEFCHLGSAQDFKRRYPADEGPNTGGMGAHAPHPAVARDDLELFDKWMQSLGEQLVAKQWHYNGIVFLGLMRDGQSGWKLLEFNARFGDPETEALVLSWSPEFSLRSLLQVDLRGPKPPLELKPAVALALVRMEYPDPPREALNLVSWKPAGVELFKSTSGSGRVAVLAASAETLTEAGDKIFGAWTESPWKALLDWRPDILP